MSDNSDNTGPEDGNGSEAAPDSPATPQTMPGGPFIIRNQYLKDLSFENPNAPEVLVSLKAAPSVEVDINLNVNPMPDIDERTFEVEMRLRVEAKAEEKPAEKAEAPTEEPKEKAEAPAKEVKEAPKK